MKIKLIQSGGILPITKEASLHVDWTEEERTSFIDKITPKANLQPSTTRDGIEHTLEVDNKEIPINLNDVPSKYASLFNSLKKDLKIVKT